MSRVLLLLLLLFLNPLAATAQDEGAQEETLETEEAEEKAAEAQDPEQPDSAERTNMRELIDAEKKAEEVLREKREEFANVGDLPRTPLQLMVMMAEAASDKDMERAAEYLDLRYLPDELKAWNPVDLLFALRVVWNQQNLIDVTQISDEPEGEEQAPRS